MKFIVAEKEEDIAREPVVFIYARRNPDLGDLLTVYIKPEKENEMALVTIEERGGQLILARWSQVGNNYFCKAVNHDADGRIKVRV